MFLPEDCRWDRDRNYGNETITDALNEEFVNYFASSFTLPSEDASA